MPSFLDKVSPSPLSFLVNYLISLLHEYLTIYTSLFSSDFHITFIWFPFFAGTVASRFLFVDFPSFSPFFLSLLLLHLCCSLSLSPYVCMHTNTYVCTIHTHVHTQQPLPRQVWQGAASCIRSLLGLWHLWSPLSL